MVVWENHSLLLAGGKSPQVKLTTGDHLLPWAEPNWIHKSSDFFGVPQYLLIRPRRAFKEIKGPCPPFLRAQWDHQPNETAGHEIVHHFYRKNMIYSSAIHQSVYHLTGERPIDAPGNRWPITMNLPPPVFHSSNLASQPKSSIPQNITSYQTRAEHKPIFGDECFPYYLLLTTIISHQHLPSKTLKMSLHSWWHEHPLAHTMPWTTSKHTYLLQFCGKHAMISWIKGL